MTAARSPIDLVLCFNINSVRAEGRSQLLRVIEGIKENKIGPGKGKARIFKGLAEDFKVKASLTQLFLNTSPVILNAELVNVHPLIKLLFSKEILTKAVDITPTCSL